MRIRDIFGRQRQVDSIPVGHLKLNADGRPVVTTIYGEMEEKDLRREVDISDNAQQRTIIVLYYLGAECVHRSTHIQLKQGLGIEGMLARL